MASAIERGVVVGVFSDRHRAQEAIQELKRSGFRDEEIGVVARDEDEVAGRVAEDEGVEGSNVGKGLAIGAASGAGIGGLWAIGIAAGLLPAIGPVIAGGILASLLASAGVGAAVGGVAGALIGLGVPEEDAEFYEGEFKSGRTIVTVRAAGRYGEAMSILRRFGGYDRSGYSATEPGVVTGGSAVPGGVRGVEDTTDAGQCPPTHRTLEVPVSEEEVRGVDVEHRRHNE